jgi:hypothetical protein
MALNSTLGHGLSGEYRSHRGSTDNRSPLRLMDLSILWVACVTGAGVGGSDYICPPDHS